MSIWFLIAALALLPVESLAQSSYIITTVAGSGENGASGGGYSGDGGPATQARLYYPDSVVADTQGNLFIADTRNHIIRKVDVNGIITTIAGTPGMAG